MLYEKIILLNQTIIECLNEHDERKILKAFTDLGIKILEADFGFVWLNSYVSKDLELIYVSPNVPYAPKQPQKRGRNYRVLKNCVPDFVSRVRKRSDEYDVSRYMKSFVIIPISHRAQVYGNIVICFKYTELFSKEKRTLCAFIGNIVAEAIAIRRLMAGEHERMLLEEDRKRTRFIADAAHELRTPLAIIKGNVDLALQNEAGSLHEARKALTAVDLEVKRLVVLISDMTLLTSSMKPPQQRLVLSKMHLRPLVEDTLERCRTLAEKKNITLVLGDFPDLAITGDEFYLEKLFANIIKNAIVYGKDGGHVEVSASKKGTLAQVSILDNGIGIPQKDLSYIFERFYRSATARAQNNEGTGLGLAIAEWIVEAHGGSISVKSSEDKGSVFVISLPLV